MSIKRIKRCRHNITYFRNGFLYKPYYSLTITKNKKPLKPFRHNNMGKKVYSKHGLVHQRVELKTWLMIPARSIKQDYQRIFTINHPL